MPEGKLLHSHICFACMGSSFPALAMANSTTCPHASSPWDRTNGKVDGRRGCFPCLYDRCYIQRRSVDTTSYHLLLHSDRHAHMPHLRSKTERLKKKRRERFPCLCDRCCQQRRGRCGGCRCLAPSATRSWTRCAMSMPWQHSARPCPKPRHAAGKLLTPMPKHASRPRPPAPRRLASPSPSPGANGQ